MIPDLGKQIDSKTYRTALHSSKKSSNENFRNYIDHIKCNAISQPPYVIIMIVIQMERQMGNRTIRAAAAVKENRIKKFRNYD